MTILVMAVCTFFEKHIEDGRTKKRQGCRYAFVSTPLPICFACKFLS